MTELILPFGNKEVCIKIERRKERPKWLLPLIAFLISFFITFYILNWNKMYW
jgi:hypothetical protein